MTRQLLGDDASLVRRCWAGETKAFEFDVLCENAFSGSNFSKAELIASRAWASTQHKLRSRVSDEVAVPKGQRD